MALSKIQAQERAYPAKPSARFALANQLFTDANVWVQTRNSNHIEMDWTIDGATAQAMGINCYRVYVHIHGTSKHHDYVIATERDSVMVFPGQQSKSNTVKFVIDQNAVNYMHSPVKQESESYYIEALESWDSPKGSGIIMRFNIHFAKAAY